MCIYQHHQQTAATAAQAGARADHYQPPQPSIDHDEMQQQPQPAATAKTQVVAHALLKSVPQCPWQQQATKTAAVVISCNEAGKFCIAASSIVKERRSSSGK
jgi:hypothetical protein